MRAALSVCVFYVVIAFHDTNSNGLCSATHCVASWKAERGEVMRGAHQGRRRRCARVFCVRVYVCVCCVGYFIFYNFLLLFCILFNLLTHNNSHYFLFLFYTRFGFAKNFHEWETGTHEQKTMTTFGCCCCFCCCCCCIFRNFFLNGTFWLLLTQLELAKRKRKHKHYKIYARTLLPLLSISSFFYFILCNFVWPFVEYYLIALRAGEHTQHSTQSRYISVCVCV